MSSVDSVLPLNELSMILDRLEARIDSARQFRHLMGSNNMNSNQPSNTSNLQSPPVTSPMRIGLGRFLGGRSKKDNSASTTSDTTTTPTRRNTPSASPSPMTPVIVHHGPMVDFLYFPEEDAFVEDLRRAAELCVIGEHFVTSLQKQEVKQQERDQRQWINARDGLLDSDSERQDENVIKESDGKLQLFDLFFERNGLALVVDMLSGESFDLKKFPIQSDSGKDKNVGEGNDDINEKANEEDKILLPPLSIATQALQSVSIMIQNVSRATSLYVILSNNYINKLINLPLDLYTIAEKRRLLATKEFKALPAAFASPQITEVMTHFVTFLKSLALRLNSETLQFFLKFSSDQNADTINDDEDSSQTTNAEQLPTSSLERHPKIDFPLYERALDFCASHQDSFVRTTAMNICLNILRLVTVVEKDEDKSDAPKIKSKKSLLSLPSPNGVLHDAKPLHFRERRTIAQYASIPTRVERLISPIFTKLAERWNSLEEAIRNIDNNKHMGPKEVMDDVGARNERVALAREKVRRERLIRTYKEKVADLQDELLLLDDVFKVGLTVLNEQMIEMMLATFVYPLLLQPLLLYYQRLTASVDEERFSFSDHPFGGLAADLTDVDKELLPVSCPAKTALFSLATVFNFVSNRPMLRLLHTALFHPLSPDSTSAPTARSSLEVDTVDKNGHKCIRLDEVSFIRGELIPNERISYAFGTSLVNRQRSKDDIGLNDADNKAEECVFVLAPALAEILEYRGQDLSLLTRTKPNPYRKALLNCLTVPADMADVRELAICTVDALLSIFDGNFNACILFGTDLRKFADDMPSDERNLDSLYAHAQDDRGLGGCAENESRHSLGTQRGGSVGTDLIGEVISALCNAAVFSSRLPSNEWKLGYDKVATHALLTVIRYHPAAIVATSKWIEQKWRQAAILLADVPLGLNPMGGSPFTLPGAPSINDLNYEQLIFAAFLDIVFYDSLHLENASAFDESTPATEYLLQLKDGLASGLRDRNAVSIATRSDLKLLTGRVGQFLILPNLEHLGIKTFDQEMMDDRRESSRCWFKVDALKNMLKDLAATAGLSIKNSMLSGIYIDSSGTVMKLEESFDTSSIYANISPEMNECLFSEQSDIGKPASQSFVDLVDCPAIPCVIEAPESAAYLFTDETNGIVAEGITWQSLYLVFVGHFLVFAVPLPDGTGMVGRVISSCNMERIKLEYDDTVPEDGAAARRISLNYKWFDISPPPLFLFDALPEYVEHGPFVRTKPFTSRLDVWFENERAASYAYGELCIQLFKAKAQRGRRLQHFLDPQAENEVFQR